MNEILSRRATVSSAAAAGRFGQSSISLRLLLVLVLTAIAGSLHAQVRPFTARASFDERGDISMIGNVLVTCTGSGCTTAQNGSGNNNLATTYVNVDPGAGYDNSSSANLAMPAGSTIRFAGLYWGGRAGSTDSARGTIRLRVPGSGSYTAVTATQIDTHTSQGGFGSRPYQAFADVTSLVQAAGNGTYFAGDMTTDVSGSADSLGYYGGWSLIVIYQTPGAPFRRLMVFDGAEIVENSNSVDVTASGLLTPLAGSFDTYMGALVWEGDQGINGDFFRLATTNLSDALNSATNFWNSSITRLGTRISAKNPDYVNQMGMDIDYVNASGILANGATSANLRFGTSGDTYFPHALTFTVDLYVPDLVSSLAKSVVDVNGGQLLPGDILEYTVSFTNSGQDGATNVLITDPIPANTTYVPNSLFIISNATGAPTGAQSDTAGNDQAEFLTGPDRVVFRLGQGATASNGGLVPAGQGASLRFRVQLGASPALSQQTITNTATVSHNAQTLGNAFSATGSASASIVVAPLADLAITKSNGVSSVQAGGSTTYTVRVTNNGPATVTGAILSDPVAAGLGKTAVVCSPTPGQCVTPPSIAQLQGGSFALPALASGQFYEIRVTATVNATSGSVSNIATAATPAGTTDPTPGNNSATDTDTVTPVADLAITKSDGVASVNAGASTTYTVRVTNNGPSGVTGAILSDPVAAGLSKTAVVCSPTPGQCVTPPSVAQLQGGSFALPALASGQFYEIRITATVTATSGSVSNIAAVAIPAGSTDPTPGNNSATDTDTVTPVADLAVTKTNGVSAVDAGGSTVYTVRVTNNGPSGVTGAIFSDPVAAGLTKTAVVCSPTPGQCVTPPSVAQLQGGSFALPALASGQFYEVRVTATVTATSGNVSNTATAATPPGTVDPTPGNNSATDTDTVTPVADLAITKTNGVTSLDTGSSTTYTVRVTNNGPSSVTGAILSDPVAAGLVKTAVVCSPTPGQCVTPPSVAQLEGGSFALPALASGQFYEIRITADVTATSGSVSNTVNVSAPSGTTDPTPGNNAAADTDTVLAPALTIDKVGVLDATVVAPAGAANPGDVIEYTITVSNAAGTGTAFDVNVTDPLLPVLACEVNGSAASLPADIPAGGSLVCTGTYTLTQTDIDAGDVDNLVTTTGDNACRPGVDPVCSDTVTTLIGASPALTVDKSAPTGSLTVGSTLTYTVTATNTGNVTLTDVVVGDPMLTPPSTACATVAPAATCVLTGTYVVQQSDVDAGQIVNTGTADSDETGPTDDTVTTPIAQSPALSVDKSAPTGTLAAGQTISYTITATNTGDVTLTNLVVSDPMLTPSSTACATVAPAATCVLTGTYVVQQSDVDAGQIVNTGTADSDETGPTDDTVTTPIAQSPALSVDKSAPTGTLAAGQTISYTITATNTGDVTLTNLVVSDPMLTPSSTACATVAPAATCVLTGTYVVQQSDVDAGQIVNTGTADSDETGPTDDTVTTPIDQNPAMTVAKSAPTGTLAVGETITYTVTGTNTGDVTLTNVLVSDPMLTPSSATCASVAPGATCVLTGTYVVLQSDVDNGQIVNTGTGDSDETDPTDDTVTTPIDQNPAMTVAKSAPTGTLAVGETITYTVTATNTGDVTLTNVVVSDPMLTPSSTACATVAPAATCVLTGTYVVQQSDVDAGQIVNTGTGDSDETDPTDDTVTTPIDQNPAMTVDKSAPAGTLAVGQTITYTVTAINTGDVTLTNVLVSDPMLTPASATCASVAPAATCVLTGTYVIQQSDVDAGQIVNTGTGDSDETDPTDDTVTTPIDQNPAMTVAKSAPTGTLAVGQTITYTVTATNTGDVTLTNVVVSDPMLMPSSTACATVAPAATCVLTGTYVVQQSDADAGQIVNTGTGDSDETDPTDDTVTTPIDQNPAMTVAKSAPTGTLAVGQTITYTVTATNSGDVTLTDVVVSDPMLTPSSATCASVAPGATCVLTGTYVVQQSDIDAGQIVNTGTGDSDETDPTDDTVTTPIDQNPAMTVAKSAPTGTLAVGQTITYTVTATNTGDVTLTNVVVSDPMLTPSSATCASVAPGATCVLTGTYVVQQSDVDAGQIVNTGTGDSDETDPTDDTVTTPIDQNPALTVDKSAPTGTLAVGQTITYTVTATNTGDVTLTNVVVSDPMLTPSSTTCPSVAPGSTCVLTGTYVVQQSDVDAGQIVNTGTGDSDETDPTDDTVTTPIDQNPALTVDKSAPTGTLAVGETITYTVTATNTGDVTLTNVVVSDPMLTPSSTACAAVAPGATCVLTGTYVILQSDVDAGQIVNTGTGDSDQTGPSDDTVTTPITQNPALVVDKSAPTGTLTVGETITYVVTATNSGDVTLTNVLVSDPMLTPTSTTCASVAPGAACVLTGTYVVQQSDVDAGEIVNTATADSDQTGPSDDTVTTPIAQNPALTVDKSAPIGTLAVGETITYTVTATNAGDVTLTNVVVSDPMLTPPSTTCASVAPGATCVLTGTYVVQQSDVDAGQIVNTATADSDQTGPSDDTVTTPIAQSPALAVDKSAPTGTLAVGETITYVVTATNTGNVTLTNLVVSDPMLTPGSTTCPSVAPGATCVLTGTYVVQQSDVDAGQIVNTGTADSDQAGPSDDTVTTPIAQSPALSVDKSVPTGTLAVGETITYIVTATNTGNVTLTNLVVSDAMLTPSSTTCASVAPGATCVLTGTYVVQQSDVDAGQIVNTGTADSDQTGPSDDTVTTPIAQAPSLIVDKSAPTGTLAVGETITYVVTATNTGNVTLTNLVVSDPMLTPGSTTCPSVAPGATCVLTGTYVILQSDVDTGQIVNTATADSDQTGPSDDTVTTPIAQAPSLVVDKSAPTGTLAVGETITYTVTATNTGNVTLTNLVVSDPMLTPNSMTCASVAPGATCVLTGTYVILQSDVDTGQIVNTGTADSDQTGPSDDTVTTPIAQNPALSVDKSAPTGTLAVGETITYVVTATNTGNVTLTSLVVSDPMLTPPSTTCASVAPGATCVLTGTYVVQQSDVDAGQIVNTGTADSDQTGPNDDTVTTPIAQNPALAVDKSTPTGTLAVGETITYTVTATNTGNVTLTNLVVSDPMLTPNSMTCASVAPGATCVLTGTYVILQSDVDTGQIVNTGTADSDQTGPSDDTVTTPIAQNPALSVDKSTPTGTLAVGETITYVVTATNTGNVTLTSLVVSDPMLTPPSTTCASVAPGATCVLTGTYVVQQSDVDAGQIVNTGTADSDQTGPNDDTVTTPIAQNPALAVDKSTPTGTLAVGETITYVVTATNTGNVTLTNLVVSDPMLTPSSTTCPSVAPGATCVLTGTYVILQSDVDTGQIVNTGTADSDQTGPSDDTVTTPIAQNPALVIDKSAPTGTLAVGETITYVVTATNTGNVTLTNLVVSDPMLTPNSTTCPSVAPGATCVLTGTYVVQQSDVDAGQIVNTGTADSDQTGPSDDTVTTPIAQNPALSVDKSAPTGTLAVGETITYVVTATNTGNVTLTNLVVSDPMLTPNSTTCPSVAPGATCILTGTYVILQSDVDTGQIVNTGTADSDQTGPNDDTVTTPIAQNPALAVDKSAPTGTLAVGETITYVVTATNTGNVTLTNLVVSDPMLTPNSTTCATVAPAATCVLTGTYVVQQSDVNAGQIVNTASADSDQTGPSDDTVTTPIAQNPALTVDKTRTDSTDPILAGSVLTYSITIVNSGNVTLTDVTLVDSLIPALSCAPTLPTTLEPAASATCTGSYTVTPADVIAGEVVNTATGQGQPPTGSPVSDEDSVTTGIVAADLAVTKTVDEATPNVGDTVVFTLNVVNNGPDDATGVTVIDALPSGYTYVSDNGAGAYAPVTGIWTVGALADGATASLQITATVDADGEYLNTAIVSATEADPDPSNNDDEAGTDPVAQADLAVVKSVSKPTPNVGGTVDFTIVTTNNGPSDATGVVVTDVLPTGYTYVSDNGGGAYVPATGAWTVGALANGASATLVITVSVDASGEYLNVATVTGNENDPNTDNNDDDAGTTPVSLPDVAIAKTVADGNGNGIAEAGETLTYTITLSNGGGQAATGYGVTDPLDANTAFVSASNGGVHAGGTVTWSNLTVPGNGSLALTVVVTVADPLPPGVTQIGNLAYETGGTPPDCDLVPQPANCATVPTGAQVSVSKALTGESITPDGIAQPGEQLTYTITVRNDGGTPTVGTIVNEWVPLHTSFVSGAPTWTCAAGAPAGTACETLVDVPAFSSGSPGVANATFTVQVADPIPAGVQQIANAVAINDGTPPDCQSMPTAPQCAVVPTVNLTLVKSVQAVTATGPATFVATYLIELSNIGGTPTSYTLTDTLDFTPNGVLFNGSSRVTTATGSVNPALASGQFASANGVAVQLSADAVPIAAGASHSYTVTVPFAIAAGGVQNGNCTDQPGNGLFNRVDVTGPFNLTSAACAPVASDVPAIRLVKTVRLGEDGNGNGYGDVGDRLHYSFVISNPGSLPLSAIQLADPRVTDLSCNPRTAAGHVLKVLTGDEIFFDHFEPMGLGSLPPGDSITCSATYGLTANDVALRRVINTATTSGSGPQGQVVSATSTAIYTTFQ